ncbi:frizzled-5-like [Gigantopelta aegis]|uniref:frizzled-5-like n=1 Tax=Gigantopelta aegis TaxID=1735272 RepID=UPI001B88845A|nr:frizzled-5-like [Gigantopelta aegis]XP_041374278.1 frizzled-5-like [Gigantopelta aegis]XP_041374279.1 frizzled-5-like [Gigantopelta aegis]XP_041374280.1 frizzled-5-like [Gigantopelta aegis]
MHRLKNMVPTRSKLLCLLPLLILVSLNGLTEGGEQQRKCQEISIPMCKGIGYNYTYMPNQFNHETQEEAGLEVHQFWPLVEIQCSPDLKFFLCSMYAPICVTNYKKPLPACRSVCERAKAGCAPLMRQYGFAWPERMDCKPLPQYGDKEFLCMDANTTDRQTPSPSGKYGVSTTRPGEGGSPGVITQPRGHGIQHPVIPGIKPRDGQHGIRPIPGRSGGSGVAAGAGRSTEKTCVCGCLPPLVPITSESNGEFNRISTGGILNCAVNCYSPYFGQDEKTFATFWIGLWSILCCISTSMTVSTFFIDMQRFKYPERPIIFLSACYFMVSIGYIIRLIMGHEDVACDGKMIRYETTGPAVCTVVFLLIYFFGMASSIWWVILSFTWFLAAGLKWGQEAIASYSQYFHLAAWLIPSVKSIAVLAMSSVDGDPIAGICYVGNENLENLRGFVLAPLFVYLIIGMSFLLAGFVSLFRIRNVIKQQGRGKTDKLERLMIRIGVFSVLYTVPATIVIACYFYEQHLREKWERTRTCQCPGEVSGATPDYSVFMLKYFMCLVVGITSGFWIWTGKTVDSWKKLFDGKLCNKHSYSHPSRMAKYSNPSYQAAKAQPLSHV